jgi:hypothetical protein
MEEAALIWSKQLIHVSDVLGKPEQGASLTQADQDSYRVQAAAEKVAAAIPSAREAVAHYVATIGAVRTAVSNDNAQRAAGAITEAEASLKAVIAVCEASSGA